MEHRNTSSNTTAPVQKRRFGTMLLVAGVLLAEAAAFVGFMTLAGGPETAQAGSAMDVVPANPDEAVVETLVLDSRLQNNRSGVTYVCDTEIWVQIRVPIPSNLNPISGVPAAVRKQGHFSY